MTAASFKMGLVKYVVQNAIAFRFFSSTAFRSLNLMVKWQKSSRKFVFYFILQFKILIKGKSRYIFNISC